MPRPRFLAASSCQVEETLADLIDFLSTTTFLSSFFSPGFLSAGLCKVPSAVLAGAATGATGSGALMTRRGAFIIALICATSSCTALRARSVAADFSAASLAACATFCLASSLARRFFSSAAGSSCLTAAEPAASPATGTCTAAAAAFLASVSAFLASFSAFCAALACASFSASNLARRSCFSINSASWRAINSA